MPLHRKIFACAVLLSVFAVNVHSQIRSYVGIVRGQFSPEFIRKMESCREKIRGAGYISYAKAVDSYLEGGFGSGFVYTADDGTTYVLTNRHVIMEADTASIEFENSDGASELYEGLTVAAANEDIDIVLLAFSSDGKRIPKKGLSFSSAAVKDGQEVWSAGFPGLGSEPVWQLGKGTVTNASARIKELIDPSVSVVIQHSAEVDRGNSGGPLLVSSKKDAGYEVVGVNTWKAAYRQNTNFAVPASAVAAFIKNSRKKSAETEEKDVRDCAEQFVSALNKSDADFTSIVKLISVEMALDAGSQDFIDAMKFAPSSDRNHIASEFGQFPVEGLRCACAYQLWQKCRPKENEEALAIVSAERKSGGYAVSVASNDSKKTVDLMWTKENSSWKISGASSEEEKEAKEKKKSSSRNRSGLSAFEVPSFLDISGGALICFPGSDLGFHANIDLWNASYMGIGLLFEHFPFDDKSMNLGGVGLIGRIPYNISEIMNIGLVGRAGFDIGRYDSWGILGYFAEAGLEFLYTGSYVKPGLGVSFKYSKQNEWLSFDDDKEVNESFKIVKVYAKIAF